MDDTSVLSDYDDDNEYEYQEDPIYRDIPPVQSRAVSPEKPDRSNVLVANTHKIELNKSIRQAILQKLQIENAATKEIRENFIKSKEERRQQVVWQKAMFEASSNNHILGLAWQHFGKIDSFLYQYEKTFSHSLLQLKIPGMDLDVFPDEFGHCLHSLKVLSLSNNNIKVLPESILLMTNLKELNLLKNKLVALPDRIGLLCRLEKLEIANNLIERLPITFGGLNLIGRCNIECNRISILPENLDNMTNCKYFNVNTNGLIRLPRCIARMPSLTSLSAFNNKIAYIPQELVENTNIKVLRLSINQIKNIPDRIGNLKKLKELTLENNDISVLPMSFYMLSKLKVLRIDGNNNLNDPPSHILGDGAEAVVQYCKDKYNNNEVWRMRVIISSLQNVLLQIKERNIGDAAYYEPDTIIAGEQDTWFALQLQPYFWKEALVKLQKLWRREALRGISNSNWISAFTYDEKEVNWALTRFSDAYGPLIRKQNANFRRCACVDDDGNRKPCQPPRPGFMCNRLCTCIKMNIISKRFKSERLWEAYKASGIADAIKRAETEARLYLDSTEGKLWLEETAFEKAEEMLYEQGASSAMQKKQAVIDRRKKLVIKRYNRMMQKIQKIRDSKAIVLQQELDHLNEEVKVAIEGYMKTSCENRINNLALEIARIPETQYLKELQRQCENECSRIDEELLGDSSDSSAMSNESMPSSDDETPAADRRRKRIEKKIALQQLLEEEARRRIAFDVPMGSIESITHSISSRLSMFVPRNEDYEKAAGKVIKLFNRRIKNVSALTSLRVKKLMKKSNGNFTEIQREMRHDLAIQYVNSIVSDAKDRATREFAVIEQVRQSTAGAGIAMVFNAWKHYFQTRKQRARRDIRAAWRQEVKGFTTAMESIQSTQAQVDLWKKYTDIYTDVPFWKHIYSEEITIDKPTVVSYLPPGFIVPPPPNDLPPDVSLETSSDESGDGNRVGRVVRKIRRRKKSNTASGGGGDDVGVGVGATSDGSDGEGNDGATATTDGSSDGGKEDSSGTDGDDEGTGNIRSGKGRVNNNVTVRHLAADEEAGILNAVEDDAVAETGTVSSISRRYTRNISSPKQWEHVEAGRSNGNSIDCDGNSINSNASRQSSIQSSKYSYGPDSITAGSFKGRLGRPLYADDTSEETRNHNAALVELDNRLAVARRYMTTDKYKGQTDFQLPDISKSDMSATRVYVKEKVETEIDKAERAIRVIRNNLSVTRHATYIQQANRRPKSFETKQLEKQAKIAEEEEKYKHAHEEELLVLAGGNIGMSQMAGEQGMYIRTVLAYRALHVKDKLHKRAVRQGLASPKKANVYGKSIAPLWREDHVDSDEEDEVEREKRQKLERKEKRAKDREAALVIQRKFLSKVKTGDI